MLDFIADQEIFTVQKEETELLLCKVGHSQAAVLDDSTGVVEKRHGTQLFLEETATDFLKEGKGKFSAAGTEFHQPLWGGSDDMRQRA